jgi:hypothetical protein
MDSWLRIGSHCGLLWSTEECLGSITAENSVPVWKSSTAQRNLYAPMNELLCILRVSLMLKKSALCPYGVFIGFICYRTALICPFSWFVFVNDKECFFERCELNVWNINLMKWHSANPESNILYVLSPVKMQALVKQYSHEDIVLSYHSVRTNIVCSLPSVKM